MSRGLRRWGSSTAFKMVGYVISAVICGIAGTLFASWRNMSRPTSCIGRGQAGDDHHHSWRWARWLALLGAIVFLLLEESLPLLLGTASPGYTENWMIIFGPLLIMVVLFGRVG